MYPTSATFYKGHFVLVGLDGSKNGFITAYDTSLKQALPPTNLPFHGGAGAPAGAKIFASGGDLILVYGWAGTGLFDLRMMRFRIKGI
jgi:hypothetical protein